MHASHRSHAWHVPSATQNKAPGEIRHSKRWWGDVSSPSESARSNEVTPHLPPSRDVVVQPKQEAMWKHHGGESIENTLNSGAVILCEAKWLVEFAKSGAPLKPRQQLPEEAFITLNEIKTIGCPAAGLPIIAISHPWLHPDHPDPKGAYLSLVGKVLDAFTSSGQRYAVFWDFLSLHQHPDIRNGVRRSGVEEKMFRKGLKCLGVLFAHRKITIFKVTHFPLNYPESYDLPAKANSAEYTERGWCFTETTLSRMTKDNEFHLDLSQFDESMSTRDAVVRACKDPGGKEPPPLLDEFTAKVKTKSFGNQEVQLPIILDVYKCAFQTQFGNAVAFNYSSLGWENNQMSHLAKVIELAVPVKLRGIYLFDNQIGDEGMKSFSKALARTVLGCVEELSLRENKIGDEGFKAFSQAVAGGALPSLQKFYMERNAIGNEGLRAFSAALGGGALSKLEVIILSMNEIGDPGVKALADAICKGALSRVERLYLEGNRIGDKGLKALAVAFGHSTTLDKLESLWLNTNMIGNAGIEALATATLNGALSNLKELFLGSNKIGNQGMQIFSRAIADGALANLEWLSLRDNQISEEMVAAFSQSVEGGSLVSLD